ncbi:MAG: hypothetical protein Q7S82_00500 [bacterium]|nr:hypothetical protein [bacterium]
MNPVNIWRKFCKITFPILILGVLLFGFVLLYNQRKEVSAEDIAPPTTLVCGKEIPNGEAMDKTAELLYSLVIELSVVNENAYQEVKNAEEMIQSAGQCNINVCQSVDCGTYKLPRDCNCRDECTKTYCDPVTGICSCLETSWTCDTCWDTYCNAPSACSSPWGGRACPQSDIETLFNNINNAYNKIVTSKKEIWALIDGTYGGLPKLPEVDKTESLCPRINEDIRTPSDELLCVGCPNIPNPLCSKITKIEVIKRKLDKARSEFDKCYIPPSDWERVAKREISGKTLLSCDTIMSQQLPRETKTTIDVAGKPLPVCTSPHNYFCCH